MLVLLTYKLLLLTWQKIILSEEVSFLNKGSILRAINGVPTGSQVVIDASKSKGIDHDVVDVLKDFRINAESRNVGVQVLNIPDLEPVPREEKDLEIDNKRVVDSKN